MPYTDRRQRRSDVSHPGQNGLRGCMIFSKPIYTLADDSRR
jgi:hypothetical protein